jgi:acyl-coenzyme A thioesterase PaaI-like protein
MATSTSGNSRRFPPELLESLGFIQLLTEDKEKGSARVQYHARPAWAHSGGTTIQGGFVTAWLDNCMAFAIAARLPDTGSASLEIKVSFLDRTAPGTVTAEARIRREGGSVAFLEADLFAEDGRLLATATSTVKLMRPRG